MKTTLPCLINLFILLLAGCSPATPTGSGLTGVDPIIGLTVAPASPTPFTQAPGNQPSVLASAVPSTNSATASPKAAQTSQTPSGAAATAATAIPAQASKTPASQTASLLAQGTVTSTLVSEDWKKLPVIPVVSDHVLEIFQRGQELGNNPRAFSKIGDCGSTPAWFLGDFDRGPSYYRLGKYQNLAQVIQQFQGSFDRTSLAARSGFNASALFVPIWADRSSCGADEGPLTCEYRVNKPVIAFIMLGTNDVWHPEEFEPEMRKIIEYSVQQGVIPILSTKADNKEGNGSINATIAKLALEYQVPLWNFFAAVDSLANNGLQEDMAHLTFGRNLFDNPEAMSKAWPVRNLTALQALDAVWQKIK